MATRSAVLGLTRRRDTSALRRSASDRRLLLLTMVQGGIGLGLLAACVAGVLPAGFLAAWVAVSLWWGSNTIAHIHIHTPLFQRRRHNRGFALYLTALLGIPQSLWRARHLWHHAGEPADRPPRVPTGMLAVETGLILAVWGAVFGLAPRIFTTAWLPGWGLGLCLCALHGHFEHAGAGLREDPGVSSYGRLYNRFWFNDGYHAEHHRWPGRHWTDLPRQRLPQARASDWPPVLRWLDLLRSAVNGALGECLDRLERAALRSRRLQDWLIDVHEMALRRLLISDAAAGVAIQQVTIVGGGLFPRTALALRRVLPAAELRVMETEPDHIAAARRSLSGRAVPDGEVAFQQRAYRPGPLLDADLAVFPLAFRGDREALYRTPPSRLTVVHDWLWRRRGQTGTIVSPLLLKRVNLVIASIDPRL